MYIQSGPWSHVWIWWEEIMMNIQSGLWSHVWNRWEEIMVLYRQRVVYCLMYGIGVKRPWCCIDRTSFIHETRNHSICLYNNMVSSCQFHTWDHRPLCIYNIMVFSHQFQTIEHSVYTTLMYGIGEKRPWCCIDWEWSLFSCIELVWRDHGVV
jgi:hypothetical protein